MRQHYTGLTQQPSTRTVDVAAATPNMTIF
jgi:hypothetical protein